MQCNCGQTVVCFFVDFCDVIFSIVAVETVRYAKFAFAYWLDITPRRLLISSPRKFTVVAQVVQIVAVPTKNLCFTYFTQNAFKSSAYYAS